jgi:aminoglycoside phosphotransferase (APT) family kinase protein
MQYAPPPTEKQIERVSAAIGAASLTYSGRIEGGLGSTMDVLLDGSTRLVLRRYGSWYDERGENAALRETRALELVQRANIPAPAPIWIDTDGVFDEQATIISYVEGKPLLSPSNPFDWAERLASVLARIHDVRLDDEDQETFSAGAGEDVLRISENPEVVLEHPLGEDLLRRQLTLGGRDSEGEKVFSHADFWPGNTLWRDSDLVAVVDWESAATGPRAMDVAYCSLDIRYLGMDKVADHFIGTYREVTSSGLGELAHWEAIALCRPMPDIARWVPAWVSMGRDISPDTARERFTSVLEDFLERTA